MTRRYVVLSTDFHPWYAFYAPLTCSIWKSRGWTPLLLLGGTVDAWLGARRAKAILGACEDVGDSNRIHFTGVYPNTRSATVAQVSRLFGHSAPGIKPDDFLLTSDIDMWPVGDWVGGVEPTRAFQMYFSNAHNDGRVHFPMCYVGAEARHWAEVMEGFDLASCLVACTEQPETPETSIRHNIGTDQIPLSIWNWDEAFLGRQLEKWSGWPNECQLIPRDFDKPGEKRLDRSSWRWATSLDGYADAHMPRPGFSREFWPSVRQVFSLLAPDKLKWADEYYKTVIG